MSITHEDIGVAEKSPFEDHSAEIIQAAEAAVLDATSPEGAATVDIKVDEANIGVLGLLERWREGIRPGQNPNAAFNALLRNIASI